MSSSQFYRSVFATRILLAISIVVLTSSNGWAQGGSASAGLTQVAGGISVVASGAGAYYTCTACHTCKAAACTMTCVMCASLVANTATSAAGMAGAGSTQGDLSNGAGLCTPGDTSCAGGYGPNPTPSTPGAGGFGGGPNGNCAPADLVCLGNIASSNGYKYNPADNSISTPKGKFPASALASGQSMAAAGIIGKDEVGKADALIKAINDKMKVSSVGVAGGGGGGGSGGGVKYEYTNDTPLGGMQKPKGPTTAGLTRTLASGELIGSQVDDIFEMITRKYQEKSKENIFVGQQPGSVPAPAPRAGQQPPSPRR